MVDISLIAKILVYRLVTYAIIIVKKIVANQDWHIIAIMRSNFLMLMQ